jgi:cyclic pyranopterin phosphate synthase
MGIRDVDNHKLHLHPEEVSYWLKTGTTPAPLHVEIGPTNRCNHKCIFCTLDWMTHGSSDIEEQVLLRAIRCMAAMGVKSVYFAGEGEPTLHSSIFKFVSWSRANGISVALSTNGVLFDYFVAKRMLPDLSWIRFSLDAGKASTYGKIHGVSPSQYAKVLGNIQNACRVKKVFGLSVDIGVQCILMPENINEIEELARVLKDMNVDNFQIKPCHNHPKSSFSPSIFEFSHDDISRRLSGLEDDNFKVVVRSKSMERLSEPRNYVECYGFQFFSLIDSRGNVVPCNIFYNENEYLLGNLYEMSFSDIWTSERRKKIIEKIARKNHDMCGEYRCRPDVLNRYLWRVKHPEKNDEFI